MNDLARHAPAVYLARAVVDAKGTHAGEDPHNSRLALPAQNQHTTVDNPPLRFRARYLGPAETGNLIKQMNGEKCPVFGFFWPTALR
jgi:hypothetical protein